MNVRFLTFYTVVLPSTSDACVIYPVAALVRLLLPIVDCYLKELCDTIIKFNGVFAHYRCFIAPYNLFIMAWLLYMLWLTSLVCACSQGLMHVTSFSELVMYSYHIM